MHSNGFIVLILRCYCVNSEVAVINSMTVTSIVLLLHYPECTFGAQIAAENRRSVLKKAPAVNPGPFMLRLQTLENGLRDQHINHQTIPIMCPWELNINITLISFCH